MYHEIEQLYKKAGLSIEKTDRFINNNWVVSVYHNDKKLTTIELREADTWLDGYVSGETIGRIHSKKTDRKKK